VRSGWEKKVMVRPKVEACKAKSGRDWNPDPHEKIQKKPRTAKFVGGKNSAAERY
jgi:hypothetical protein